MFDPWSPDAFALLSTENIYVPSRRDRRRMRLQQPNYRVGRAEILQLMDSGQES
jgi:hypothetical protein